MQRLKLLLRVASKYETKAISYLDVFQFSKGAHERKAKEDIAAAMYLAILGLICILLFFVGGSDHFWSWLGMK